MKKIYFSSSCSSSRKTIKFFNEHNISYTAKNIIKDSLTDQEIKTLLQFAPNGVNDIIATKAKYIKTHAINIETLRLPEIYQLIKDEPRILKRPIIVDFEKKKIQVGYNEDEIEIFLRSNLDD
ncbi:Regulatory protein Spx [Spiroplasma sp. JKS002669]|uniref:Spx/MgsR family RNA polymerase-binding regulatory protein n=1 Tax=Spiroplasma attinicola TaxID=2904537 RepID=UPI00202305E8|nr:MULTISPECIES: Spx/MgsR family RNA polymerase-binding regulatory protein [unclassified Spiroplasma]MCL6429085.1 Regulatory protein Spx [Spiroplasma sp. JKS002669]MCL8209608.1 Regulatory protein Spx [Spiroplasma sp. JKS002670]MCL8210418.1 Regulatory protein Spx [Spiroplasma sp. JKS002671]